MASNITTTPGTSDVTGPYNTAETVVLAIVIGSLSFLTLAGNILVVIAFATDKKIRTFGNYFILNLSVTDIFVGLLIPIYAPYPFLGRWPFGQPACVAFLVVDYIVPLASSWNIAVISLDRYLSVSRPIMYRLKQSTKWAVVFMAIPWVAGFLIFVPAIIVWDYATGKQNIPDGQCYVPYFAHVPYLLFGSFMEFVVPFVIVALANLFIYLNIRKRSKNSASAGDDDGTKKASLARDRKTARSLAILVGVYFLTWGPYEICAMMNPLCGFCVPDKVFEVTFWLLWTNSTINPILYPFLQMKFRVAFKRLLCGRCQGTSRVQPMEGTGTVNDTIVPNSSTVPKNDDRVVTIS